MSDPRNRVIAQNLISALIMGGNDMDYTRALAASMYEESAYKNVLSSKGEDQLKDRKFTSDDSVQGTCPIMHIPFDIGDNVTALPCGHIFEPEGIRRWLKDEKAECPVCRFKLESVEVKNKDSTEQQTTPQSDVNELVSGRNNFIASLQRLNNLPRVYSAHPFGPASHRMASIVHEEDDANDVMQAIINTLGQPSNVPPQFGALVSVINSNFERNMMVNDNDFLNNPPEQNIMDRRIITTVSEYQEKSDDDSGPDDHSVD